jgi:hypothetical protein
MTEEPPPIRQWLRDNGYDIEERQRIPAEAVAAYHAAFPPVDDSIEDAPPAGPELRSSPGGPASRRRAGAG